MHLYSLFNIVLIIFGMIMFIHGKNFVESAGLAFMAIGAAGQCHAMLRDRQT